MCSRADYASARVSVVYLSVSPWLPPPLALFSRYLPGTFVNHSRSIVLLLRICRYSSPAPVHSCVPSQPWMHVSMDYIAFFCLTYHVLFSAYLQPYVSQAISVLSTKYSCHLRNFCTSVVNTLAIIAVLHANDDTNQYLSVKKRSMLHVQNFWTRQKKSSRCHISGNMLEQI